MALKEQDIKKQRELNASMDLRTCRRQPFLKDEGRKRRAEIEGGVS